MQIKKGQVWECLISYAHWKKGVVYVSILDGYLTDEVGDNVRMSDVDFIKNHFRLFEEDKPQQYNLGIDTFKRCEANMTKEEILTCAKFNIDKYNWRKKGQDKEDLVKIIKYAEWALKNID